MKIDLDKKGLITLVNGCNPDYSLFDMPLIKDNGSYNGSYGTWSWDYYKLKELTEEDLYSIYLMCQ